MSFEDALSVTLAVLIVAPPAGILLVRILSKRAPKLIGRLSVCCLVYLAAFTFALVANLRTVSTEANFAFCITAYFSYSYLAPAISNFKSTRLFKSFSIILYFGLFPGYFMATIGFLGLGFLLSDELSPPLRTERFAPGLVCVTTGWGAAMGPSGYDVALYKTPAWLPFIRHRAAFARVDQTNPGGIEQTCATVAARIRWGSASSDPTSVIVVQYWAGRSRTDLRTRPSNQVVLAYGAQPAPRSP